MKTANLASQSRLRLDERLSRLKASEQLQSPPRGWIRAVREALGMTTAQLAGRLGVSQPTVVAFERSEERGSIQLSTLRRVAEALDCHVVYALVPRTSLEATIRQRAQRWLLARRDTVEHTMRLEAQEATAPLTEADVDDVLRSVSPRRLWD